MLDRRFEWYSLAPESSSSSSAQSCIVFSTVTDPPLTRIGPSSRSGAALTEQAKNRVDERADADGGDSGSSVVREPHSSSSSRAMDVDAAAQARAGAEHHRTTATAPRTSVGCSLPPDEARAAGRRIRSTSARTYTKAGCSGASRVSSRWGAWRRAEYTQARSPTPATPTVQVAARCTLRRMMPQAAARPVVLMLCAVLVTAPSFAQTPPAVSAEAERKIEEVLRQVITWRRDFHQHPELGMQETRTSRIVADHLRALGTRRAGRRARGADGCRRHAEGRQARPGRGPALRHGRTAGHRGRGPAVQVDGQGHVERRRRPA